MVDDGLMKDNLLEAILPILIREGQPEKIILFGSKAKGYSSGVSDYDFLIVKPKSEWKSNDRLKELSRMHFALKSIFAPMDLLLYTPEEMREWENSVNHVIGRAKREGVLLYERSETCKWTPTSCKRELRALCAMTDCDVFSEEIFGFHYQQIVEKSL